MAIYNENIVDIELTSGSIFRSFLSHSIGSGDELANRFGVRVFRNGEPEDISGTCFGLFIRADGATVAISDGTVSGNVAYVTLPESCYAVEGQFTLAIKCQGNGGDVTGTMRIVDGVVSRTSTDTTVDPGTIIPSVSELINQINSAVESIPPEYDNFVKAFLSRGLSFDLCDMYGIKEDKTAADVVYEWDGDECTVSGTADGTSFNNILNIPIPSDAVKSPFSARIEMEGDFQNVYVAVFAMKNGGVIESTAVTESRNVVFTDSTASSIIVRLQVTSGTTASGTIRVRVMNQDAIPFGTNPFNKIANNSNLNDAKTGSYLLVDSNTYTNAPPVLPAFLMVFEDANATLQISYPYTLENKGTFMRVKRVNGTWSNWVALNVSGGNISQFASGGVVEINDVRTNGFYLIHDSLSYQNLPFTGSVGMLFVFSTMNLQLQVAIPFTPNAIYMRRNLNNGTWNEWSSVSGGGSGDTYNITNEYSFPEYSQTVTVEASPTITTDTNNYLAPTGDNTDRTTDIVSMLTLHGVCRLGPGKYVVNNLQMPDGSAIIGSGYATLIDMAGTSDGFAVKIGSRCMIQDVRIRGADNTLTFGSTIGGRHGILWQGDYTQHSTAPEKAMLNNVWIENFTGGGITCYDTGYGTMNALEVVNAYITYCWAGINISYWSEFHKFTNVRAGRCRIGCVNNGGNNVFVNCDFSLNEEIGMLMDNSQGQSPNNTHGSAIGCVFNHTSHNNVSNAGTGIQMLNCTGNGFIFSGCQIFFSQIDIEGSDGVEFSNCNFGYVNCDITINGGGAVLFLGNMHQAKPTITITNNPNVHFTNCYIRTTGAIMQP